MVYSPKIREELIPALYHYSKHLQEPMTRTTDRLIYQGLATESLPEPVTLVLPGLDHPYFRDLMIAYNSITLGKK